MSEESLDSLLARLGSPPRDVLHQFHAQLVSLARQHDATSAPWPALKLTDIQIGPDGRLNVKTEATGDDADSPSGEAVTSTDRVNRLFRQQGWDIETNESQEATTSQVSRSNASAMESTVINVASTHSVAQADDRPSKLSRRVVVVASGVTLAFVLCGLLTVAFWPAADQLSSQSVDQSESENVRPTAVPVDDSPLATFTSIEEEMTSALAESSSDLDGEDLIPEIEIEFAMPPEPADVGKSVPSGDGGNPTETETTNSVTDDASLMGSQPEPADPSSPSELANLPPVEDRSSNSVQETQMDVSASVLLPRRDDLKPLTLPWPEFPPQIDLKFPVPVSLQVSKQAAGGWQITGSGGEPVVALLEQADDAVTFRWTEAARAHSESRRLLQGCLVGSGSQQLFLRPKQTTQPLAIELAQPRQRPEWKLIAPITPRISQVRVETRWPETLEIGWIQPLQKDAGGKVRGLAVVTLPDDEEVGVAIRFEFSAAKSVQGVLTYAARLDPSMGWQPVTSTAVSALADRLARQTRLLALQQTQMDVLYERSSSTRRRDLGPRRDSLEQNAEVLKKWTDRVSALQLLIRRLEASASLRLNVNVTWPEGTIAGNGHQVLLECG